MKIGVPFRIFEIFVLKRRAEVMARCLETMNPGAADTCLEIGGPTNSMSDLTTRFKQYTVINMDADYLRKNRSYYSGNFQPMAADGCRLPFKDKSFDFIFANALLEHIPRPQRHLFAAEVGRICRKGFFIINDNHWFPLDPHYLVPFYQYLPHGFKRSVSRYVAFKWFPKGTYDPIDLLTIKEYKKLFPGARYEGLRFPFSPVAESIIVWDRFGQNL